MSAAKQLYLMCISAMNTSDECDVVPSAEIVVDGDFGGIDSLRTLATKLADSMAGIPLENVRPMTRDEIQTWRSERDDDPDTHVIFERGSVTH